MYKALLKHAISLARAISLPQLTVTHALDKHALVARKMLVEDKGTDGQSYTDALMEVHRAVQKLV